MSGIALRDVKVSLRRAAVRAAATTRIRDGSCSRKQPGKATYSGRRLTAWRLA
jgi:hypothetical protein